jgi:hypothetical protein
MPTQTLISVRNFCRQIKLLYRNRRYVGISVTNPLQLIFFLEVLVKHLLNR